MLPRFRVETLVYDSEHALAITLTGGRWHNKMLAKRSEEFTGKTGRFMWLVKQDGVSQVLDECWIHAVFDIGAEFRVGIHLCLHLRFFLHTSHLTTVVLSVQGMLEFFNNLPRDLQELICSFGFPRNDLIETLHLRHESKGRTYQRSAAIRKMKALLLIEKVQAPCEEVFALAGQLHSANWPVRQACVSALGELPVEALTPEIVFNVAKLVHDDRRVAKAVATVLPKMLNTHATIEIMDYLTKLLLPSIARGHRGCIIADRVFSTLPRIRKTTFLHEDFWERYRRYKSLGYLSTA